MAGQRADLVLVHGDRRHLAQRCAPHPPRTRRV